MHRTDRGAGRWQAADPDPEADGGALARHQMMEHVHVRQIARAPFDRVPLEFSFVLSLAIRLYYE